MEEIEDVLRSFAVHGKCFVWIVRGIRYINGKFISGWRWWWVLTFYSNLPLILWQCCNESSRWLGLESTRVAIFNDSTRVQYEKWLDSSQQPQMTRLADFAVNDSSQLSYNLYRINSSKLLWFYCMGRIMSPVNNENFETLSENIWDLHRIYFWRACLYYISVFRNNASATVFKMEHFLYLY
jgi:hypothetical protein